jgi:hypothetical protein
MNVIPYKNLTILVSSRPKLDDGWIPEARVEVPIGDQVTSYRVPINSQHSFPTEPEAEAKKQAIAWIDWIYPSAPE